MGASGKLVRHRIHAIFLVKSRAAQLGWLVPSMGALRLGSNFTNLLGRRLSVHSRTCEGLHGHNLVVVCSSPMVGAVPIMG